MRQWSSYPDYQRIRNTWVGRIPSHWRVERLKAVADVRLSNVDKKSEEGQKQVRLCNYVDVYHHDRITSDMSFMEATASEDQIRRFALKSGDVLITKDSESWTDIAVPAVVEGQLENVLCGYHLALLRPSPEMHGPFLSRAISAIGPREQFRVSANGVTRFGLSADAIATAMIPLPPMEEQRAIASFLDRQTVKLDALYATKQHLLDVLEEKRHALLTRALTGFASYGHESVSTASAIFGAIPKRWKLRRLRRLINPVKRPVVVQPTSEYREIGIRSWGRGIFHKDPVKGALLEDKSVFYLQPGDLVLNIVFAWEGAVAIVSEHEQGMIASHRFPTFRCSEEVNSAYLLMLLQSEQGRALMSINSPGAAGRNRTIRMGQFLAEEVPLPPLSEQYEIVSSHQQEQVDLEALLLKVRAAVARVEELRRTLIAAAVTGQIDVRNRAHES